MTGLSWVGLLHIEFCKNLAECTNNKDIFLTLLRWHVRAAHLQYLRNLEVDMADAGDDDDPGLSLMKRAVQTLKQRQEERGKEGGSGEEDLDDSDVGDE